MFNAVVRFAWRCLGFTEFAFALWKFFPACVHEVIGNTSVYVCESQNFCMSATDVTHYVLSYRVLGSIVAFPNDAWSYRPGNSGAGEEQVCLSVGETTSRPPVNANEALDQPANYKEGPGLLKAN